MVGLTILVVILIVVCGGAGGYAGYLLGPPDPKTLPPEERPWQLRRSLVLGCVAAFLVPLFLQITTAAVPNATTLIDTLLAGTASPGIWFVLIGLCLVAAVAGQRFIQAVRDKLLEDVLEKQDDISDEVDALQEDAAMPAPAGHVALEDRNRTVLEVMRDSGDRRPNAAKIARAVGRSENDVHSALVELEGAGMVQRRPKNGVERWRVRTAGRAWRDPGSSGAHGASGGQ